MAWWRSKTEEIGDSKLDAALRQIAEADTVAFGGVGIAGSVLPATQAYFTLEEALRPDAERLRPHLERVLEHGSPAGRVYAAELLTRIDQASGEAAWRRLATENDEITTFSGCIMDTTTLQRYAHERIKT